MSAEKPTNQEADPMHGQSGNFYADLAKSVEQQRSLRERTAEAWKKYAGYGPDYQRRNAERARSARVKIDQYGGDQLTIIASINTKKFNSAGVEVKGDAAKQPGLTEGEATDLHDYNPESRNHADIEAAYNDYLARTKPEERLVIFEGRVRPDEFISDRATAIRQASESGLLQYLARRDGVEATSGEPTDEAVARYCYERGVQPEELALVLVIRGLTHDLTKDLPDDISMDIYGEAVVNGLEGFVDYSNEQKAEISKDPVRMAKLQQQAVELAKRQNEILSSLGLPQFEIDEQANTVRFASAEDRAALAKAWDPSSEGRLSDIHTIMTEARDKHILETIVSATEDGKKVFMAYGGSHVVSLEPCLDEFYVKAEAASQPSSDKESELVGLIDSITPVADKSAMLSVLKDPRLVMSKEGREEIKKLINVDDLQPEQVRRLVDAGAKEKLNEIISLRMKEALEQILPLEALRSDNIIIDQKESADIDPIEEIRQIVTDPELTANQGAMQNVLISERSQYVLKVLKSDLQDNPYARETLAHYDEVLKAFGHDFLPRQIGFELRNPPLAGTLQEKVAIDEYQVLNAVTDLEQFDDQTQSPQNKEKVKEFIAGFDRLAQQGLTLDVLGDNVLWKKGTNGELEILIVDTGSFSNDYEGSAQSVQEANRLIDRLRQLV